MAKKKKTSEKVMDTLSKLETLINDELLPEMGNLTGKMATVELAHVQNFVREMKDAIDEFEKPINKFYDHLRMTTVPDQMDEEGITKVAIDGLGTLYVSSDVNVSVLAGQKQASFDWLKANGLADLINSTVNSSTLKAAMKEEIRAGKVIPTDIYKITPVSRAVIKKT